MKKIAFGIIAAATICSAVPAMAQVGFFAGPGGVGVGVAPAPSYGGCGYYNNCPGYYDYYAGPSVGVGIGPGWHGHGRAHGHSHR